MKLNIALLPGDYIGPEVIAEAVKVSEAVGKRYGHTFNWHEDAIGGASIDKYGEPLTQGTLDLCRNCDAILFGAAGGPKWDRPDAKNPADTALLKVRREFGLYANLRVVKVFPALVNSSTLKPEVIKDVDLIILRELTGGMYFGEPRGIEDTPSGRRGFNTMVYFESEVERILRTGFELARRRSKRLLSVDKSNVLETSLLWRQVATRLGHEYADVELSHMYVDAASMALIRDPRNMDVMVMENTFGDILSDEAAMLSGSLGMVPSASLAGLSSGRAFGLYEPIHGSDPARAGKDVDNPIATILSAALMLRYSFGLETEATAIESAVGKVVEANRTWDIMEPGKTEIGTRKMGDLIAEEVKAAA
ncbi:MAG: 3-isopropylmalate dehydrogenase [Dehalococcoidia bacterium]|nr:3-isopropylmalate dehydrogenase [Dehalococcoidia bacterium]